MSGQSFMEISALVREKIVDLKTSHTSQILEIEIYT